MNCQLLEQFLGIPRLARSIIPASQNRAVWGRGITPFENLVHVPANLLLDRPLILGWFLCDLLS
jgi:hypothetical protein